jgi:hypothetical protein
MFHENGIWKKGKKILNLEERKKNFQYVCMYIYTYTSIYTYELSKQGKKYLDTHTVLISVTCHVLVIGIYNYFLPLDSALPLSLAHIP